MPKRMNPLRIVGLVSAIVAPFAIGFIVWHWLLGLLFGGATVIGFATASFLYAHAIFKKKRSEHAGPFAAFSTILVVAFAGWFVRAGFRQEAMVAESLRLVEEVEAILRRDGHLLPILRCYSPGLRQIGVLRGWREALSVMRRGTAASESTAVTASALRYILPILAHGFSPNEKRG